MTSAFMPLTGFDGGSVPATAFESAALPLSEKHRPERLEDFVGLDVPRAVLTKFAAKPYIASWLFLGPSGTGKTSMALALAAALGADVHHIPSRQCDLEAVDALTRKCWYVPRGGKWHVVIVDEADQMSRAAQLAFLSKLDTTAAPPATIFIFTGNETSLLEKRFLSRCRTLPFETATAATAAIARLRGIWRQEAGGAAEPDYARIVRLAESNVRECLMRLELEIMCPGAGTAEPEKPLPPINADQRRSETPGRAAALKAWATRRARCKN